MSNPKSYVDFEDNLSKLGFEIKDNPELVGAVLEAMSTTATTEILSSEYTQSMEIGESLQTDMLDEALGDYEDMMKEISEHIKKEYCEKGIE